MANKPVRRRPPRTLPLPVSNDVGQGQDEQKTEVGSHPPRKNRNSALIEKLQASISPSTLLPSPLSPGAGKPQIPFFPPASPGSPVSPTSASKPSQSETPASFESPAEGSTLSSINKGRARHSIKRRPPSRQLRKSSGEEGETEQEKATSPVSGLSTADGKENEVFEKQVVENEEIELNNSESKQQQDQEQPDVLEDSEQQSLASTEKQENGNEEESQACVVSAEKVELVDEETQTEQPELDSKEEPTKQEHDEETVVETQSEPATEMHDTGEQELHKEEEN